MPPPLAVTAEGDSKREPASLSNREMRALTTVVSDVRAAVARLRPPARPIEVLAHADAIPALRDIYYMLSNEDPMDTMPGRNVLGKWTFAARCAVPILSAVHADGVKNPEGDCAMSRRGAPAVYQTLRLLSMLSAPIDEANEMLAPGCNLEVHVMDLKHALAAAPGALDAIVTMLQHYMERKANNEAKLEPAAESKVVDARIDNILRFFRNLLTPPRSSVSRELMSRDRGTHIALVGACVRADLFVTLNLLFMDRDEARNLDTRIVLLVSEVYALALRCSSAQDLAATVARTRRRKTCGGRAVVERERLPSQKLKEGRSVFESVGDCSDEELGLGMEDDDDTITGSRRTSDAAKLSKPDVAGNHENGKASAALPSAYGGSRALPSSAGGLRAALQRERSLVGGGRSVVASGRWTNRHSGGFHVVAAATENEAGDASGSASASALNPTGRPAVAAPRAKSLTSKRIVSVRNVSSRAKKTGTAGVLQIGLEMSSELLCILGAKNRPKLAVLSGRSVVAHAVRADLVNSGHVALGEIVNDLVSDVFPILIVELRERISAERQKNADNKWAGRRFYLTLVSVVTGFQRELAVRLGMEQMVNGRNGQPSKLSRGSTIMNANFEVARDMSSRVVVEWEAVRDAIDLESFKLVFETVNEAREDGKQQVKELELGTAAIKEMMKLLQCMSASPSCTNDSSNAEIEGQKHGLDPAVTEGNQKSKPGLVITMGKKPKDGVSDPESEGKSSELAETAEKAATGDNSVTDGGIDDGAEGAERPASPESHVPDVVMKSVMEVESRGPTSSDLKNDKPFSFASPLSARDVALNTLEQLFEQGPFIDTPSALTKEFDPKIHSFGHLVNAIEIAFTFTETLLGKDFTRINVARKKTKRTRAKKMNKNANKESFPTKLEMDTPAEPGVGDARETLAVEKADCPTKPGGASLTVSATTPDQGGTAADGADVAEDFIAKDGTDIAKDGTDVMNGVKIDRSAGNVVPRSRRKIVEESDDSDSDNMELVVDIENGRENGEHGDGGSGVSDGIKSNEIEVAGLDMPMVGDVERPVASSSTVEKGMRHEDSTKKNPSHGGSGDSGPRESAVVDGSTEIEVQPRDGSTLSSAGPFEIAANAAGGGRCGEVAAVSEAAIQNASEVAESRKGADAEDVGEKFDEGVDMNVDGQEAEVAKSIDEEEQNNNEVMENGEAEKTGEEEAKNHVNGIEEKETEKEREEEKEEEKEEKEKEEKEEEEKEEEEKEEEEEADEEKVASEIESEESGYDEAVCEVEGTDVIRRFATPKTLQHIALTIRAALCCVSGVSGSILPVPEGSKELYALPLVAKSLVVLQSVWKVAGSRDRGAFRCAYYNFATLHLLGVAMATAESQNAKEDTILGKLAEFGRDVTQEFYKVLTVNPALLMDTLFFPDISTQRLYASKMHQFSIIAEEKAARERGDLKGTDEESSEDDSDAIKKRQKKRAPRKKSARERNIEKQARNASRRQRVARPNADDSDEDVDDFDNLEILQKAESDGEGEGSSFDGLADRSRRSRKRSRRRLKKDDFVNDGSPSASDSPSSSSDSDDTPLVSSKSKKKRAKAVKPKADSRKSKEPAVVEFSSDDEYSDGELTQFTSTMVKDASKEGLEGQVDDDDDAHSNDETAVPAKSLVLVSPSESVADIVSTGTAAEEKEGEKLRRENASVEVSDETGDRAAVAADHAAPVESSNANAEEPAAAELAMQAAPVAGKGRILLDDSDYESD